MARNLYKHTTEGQEYQQADANQVAKQAALSEDYALRELVRLYPNGDGRTPDRGILPWTGTRPGGTVADGEPTVRTADPAFKAVFVAPFRFLLGSTQATMADIYETIDAMDDGRSANFVDAGSDAPELEVSVGTDTTANDRWTLVYATLYTDVAEPNVTRFVKDPVTGVATATPLSVNNRTKVEIGIVEGAEGASPTRPALPADGAGQYRIALAYVYCPHPFTGASVVDPDHIHDVAPVLPLAASGGVSQILPASAMWDPAGIVVANHTWDGTERPEPYLPATMTGGAERLIQLQWEGATRTIPLASIRTLDDSIDWRDRIFQTVIIAADSAASEFASARLGSAPFVPGADLRTLGTNMAIQAGQSFMDDNGIQRTVCEVTPTELSVMGAGSVVRIWVHNTLGILRGSVGGSDPAVKLFAWVRASGAFHQ
jgi:hypothetical protein